MGAPDTCEMSLVDREHCPDFILLPILLTGMQNPAAEQQSERQRSPGRCQAGNSPRCRPARDSMESCDCACQRPPKQGHDCNGNERPDECQHASPKPSC